MYTLAEQFANKLKREQSMLNRDKTITFVMFCRYTTVTITH